jgi:hypothetical protein
MPRAQRERKVPERYGYNEEPKLLGKRRTSCNKTSEIDFIDVKPLHLSKLPWNINIPAAPLFKIVRS